METFRHMAGHCLPEEVAIALTCNGTTQAVMMASPQDVKDFAYGFALTEGFISQVSDIERLDIATHEMGLEAQLWLTPEKSQALDARRRHMAGPVGCGLCGIDSLSEAMRPLPVLALSRGLLTAKDVGTASVQLRAQQPLHDATRAVHAVGFLLPSKGVVLVREDIGRHNALDKVIGALARAGIDTRSGAFIITSRISVDMVQKTAMAGCPVLIAVSAPTALAVDVADKAGVTLAAFARGQGFDVFSHPLRIETGDIDVAR